MRGAPVVLSTAGDVRALLRDMPLFGWHAQRSVSVRSHALDDRSRTRWERRITLWLTACGCQSGALAAVGVLVWRIVVSSELTFGSAAAHLAWVFGAAVAGKIVGLVVARLMLVVDLRRLSREMAP